jgi:hypothetical protein
MVLQEIYLAGASIFRSPSDLWWLEQLLRMGWGMDTREGQSGNQDFDSSATLSYERRRGGSRQWEDGLTRA